MVIIEYIAANWVKWLFAACLAALSLAYKSVAARLKQEAEKNKAIAEGVQCLLRESIVRNYNKYSEKGFCPIYVKDSLKRVYHAYSDLGGNDVATGLYNTLLDMPTDAPTEKRED